MGFNSLNDLKLAGIKWELSENQTTKNLILDDKKTTNKSEKQHVKTIDFSILKNNVVPPIAPIDISDIEKQAESTKDLNELSDNILNFNHPLKQFVKNTVMPHFTESTKLLIITDIPSDDDDNNCKIMTGNTGGLMDKMLSAIGLERNNVSILPLVFWRTPGGRTPTREELDLTKPFIKRAISLLAPSVILTLGTLTATEVADIKLQKNHGEIIQQDNGIPIVPIYHPNYMLLKPDSKQEVWNALKKLQNLLKTINI